MHDRVGQLNNLSASGVRGTQRGEHVGGGGSTILLLGLDTEEAVVNEQICTSRGDR